VKPDLLTLVLFLLAIKAGIIPAVYVGFFLGLAQDVYSPAILGQNALAKTIAGFFAGLFNEKIMRLDPIIQTVLLVITVILCDLIFLTVQVVKSGSTLQFIGTQIFTTALPQALYTLFFGIIPIFWEHFFQSATKR
ncbi:MAG: rod shape-determining protein MreD, partial [Fibrobacter sp.]|nr:rod shape-determining protein MreD [Fibrobacter sp.]